MEGRACERGGKLRLYSVLVRDVGYLHSSWQRGVLQDE
jgi:hypothetical protein